MAIVNRKDVKVEDWENKVRKLEKCEDPLTYQDEKLMNQEVAHRVVEKIKRKRVRIGQTTIWQNKGKKNEKER